MDLSLIAALWKIWLEMNNCLFGGNGKDAGEVVDLIFWTVSEWATRDKKILNISLNELAISWEQCF